MIKFIDLNAFSLVFKEPVFLVSHGSEVAQVREEILGVLYIAWYTFLLIFIDTEGNIFEVYFNM